MQENLSYDLSKEIFLTEILSCRTIGFDTAKFSILELPFKILSFACLMYIDSFT